ncbi:MAG: CTP synthase [Gemmatimonadota bacterium]
MIRVALIGDHDSAVVAHQAIPLALRITAAEQRLGIEWDWVHTTSLGPSGSTNLAGYDALWCVPASPYANTAGALNAIRFARESGRPFLGTCGGFQHALLEYAQGVWGLDAPKHAELDPEAEDPVIVPLACSLVEVQGEIRLAPGSKVARIYGSGETVAGYHCRFGLSPRHAARLGEGSPLRATGWDADGDVRVVELDGHAFFLATLFQPERAALEGVVPPLVRAWLSAAAEHAVRRRLQDENQLGPGSVPLS